jgi:hypothetical protein
MTISRRSLCTVDALTGLLCLVGTWSNNLHYLVPAAATTRFRLSFGRRYRSKRKTSTGTSAGKARSISPR